MTTTRLETPESSQSRIDATLTASVPKAAQDSVFISGMSSSDPMVAVQTRAYIGLASVVGDVAGMWNLPINATSSLRFLFQPPQWWLTYSISVLWMHTVIAPTGSVFLGGTTRLIDPAVGWTSGMEPIAITQTVPAPALVAGVLQVVTTTLYTNRAVGAASNFRLFHVQREGSNVADTFDAGSIGIVGLRLQRQT